MDPWCIGNLSIYPSRLRLFHPGECTGFWFLVHLRLRDTISHITTITSAPSLPPSPHITLLTHPLTPWATLITIVTLLVRQSLEDLAGPSLPTWSLTLLHAAFLQPYLHRYLLESTPLYL
jgi:hypothetical protein